MKLAGFKSFVDPTSINFPSSLCGVVGPNGCGKSNIIDAVRWVMGESSAKQLRGDSLTDVIFNGSGGRQPVGQASIELLFDNSDGRITGEYASYAEISVRRRVTREGNSDYFLNGTRCRRKDIMDVFLGTGLGPRSYSIIEQGMISSLITAKPEDLRVYIEEAAGISKYKERRRDTENRIRRTRENLERLTDIREELSRQIQRLQRQANAAEKYRELRSRERQLKSELLALQWQALNEKVGSHKEKIRDLEIALESKVADDARCDAEIEKLRSAQSDLNESFNAVQSRYYSLGAEIARIEQSIEHHQDARRKLVEDLSRTDASVSELNEHLQQDQARIKGWEAELAQFDSQVEQLQAALQSAQQTLQQAESKFSEWETRWSEFSDQASEPKQKAEVQQSRIQYLETSLEETRQRISRLKSEQIDPQAIADKESNVRQKASECEQLDDQVKSARAELASMQNELPAAREQSAALAAEIDALRRQIQDQQGKLSSQYALHEAALGQDDKELDAWLSAAQIQNAEFFVDKMKVEEGWESAVETVLGALIRARVVDSIDQLGKHLEHFPGGVLSLIDSSSQKQSSFIDNSLAQKVDHQVARNLLARVQCVDSFEQAIAKRKDLSPTDSLVTPEGIWIGPDWLQLNDAETEQGVLQRKQLIDSLEKSLRDLTLKEQQIADQQKQKNQRVIDVEQRINEARIKTDELAANLAGRTNEKTALELQLKQMQEASTAQLHEIASAEKRCDDDQQKLTEARSDLEQAIDLMEQHEKKRAVLQKEREQHAEQLKSARAAQEKARDESQAVVMRKGSVQTQLTSARESVARMQRQLDRLQEHRVGLEASQEQKGDPLVEMQEELKQKLEQRLQSEHELQEARQALETAQQSLREKETAKQEIHQQLVDQRELIQADRLQAQEVITRAQTLREQLNDKDPQDLLDQLGDDANEAQWRQELDQLTARIERLGPINLAAIDEFKAESERKEYLDAQNEELTSALETLENAIRKIDRETRTRFKETFEQINAGFKSLFPQLFGGGHAYLELTSEDLLETGISIMARPPGKRNSTIHLLSGGEKALTAIALVFAIFKLNPAPFCMLDEVDAPLDDTNVGRFADMLRHMSESVQFIYITHNKISMEMANQLMGVTMHEPGVSRLVTVDVDKAVEMATG